MTPPSIPSPAPSHCSAASGGGGGIGETCVFYCTYSSTAVSSPYRADINTFSDPSSYYVNNTTSITLPTGSYTIEHFKTVHQANDGNNSYLIHNATAGVVIGYSSYNEIGTSGEGFSEFGEIFTLATQSEIEIRGNGGYYIPPQWLKITHIA